MLCIDVQAASGMRLASDVRDDRGRVLLSQGAALTVGLCNTLARRGYRNVYVQDGVADDVLPQDAITRRTRVLATSVARECLQRSERGEHIRPAAVLSAVDAILSDLTSARGSVLELDALRSVSEYTYVHSVNVCVLSLLIGMATGLSGADLRALGAGALLHDVGKVFCADLCGKPGRLTDEEWVRIRQHPVDGFEILRKHQELHLYAAHIAYQHHERLDGTGYPRGMTGEKILPVARMVAVADVYDAMTADRPHAGARPPVKAMEELRRGAGQVYDAEYVRLFGQHVAVYPNGTPVLLQDGTVAIVAAQGREPGEPYVRLLGRAGKRFDSPEEVLATGDAAISQVLERWPSWLGAVPAAV